MTADWLALKRTSDVGRAETYRGVLRGEKEKALDALVAKEWYVHPYDWTPTARKPVYREHDLFVSSGMLEVGSSLVEAEVRCYPYRAGRGIDPSSPTLKLEVSWRAKKGLDDWLPAVVIRRAQRAFLQALGDEAGLSPVWLSGWPGALPQPRRGRFQQLALRLAETSIQTG